MKTQKYRCIKSYPGGPSLGMTIEPVKAAWQGLSYWINNNYFNPEDYAEFWEEVVEKDCKILSFKITHFAMYFEATDKNGNSLGMFGPPNKRESLEQCIEKYVIYSIKRLSDGEVFTVGDKIKRIFVFDDSINYNIIQ